MKYIKIKEVNRNKIIGAKKLYVEPFLEVKIPIMKGKTTFSVEHMRLILKPGGKDLYHYHNETYDLFTVNKGLVNILVNDEEIKLQKGDSLLVEPGDKHKLYNSADEVAEVIETRLNVIEDDKIIIERTKNLGKKK